MEYHVCRGRMCFSWTKANFTVNHELRWYLTTCDLVIMQCIPTVRMLVLHQDKATAADYCGLNCTSLVGYPTIIPYTKFEQFGIIRFFLVMLWTNKLTMSNVLFTPTDISHM